MDNKKPANFNYFLLFLRKKIDEGEKQIRIAKSVNKTPSYINWLFKGNPKSVPINIQKNISKYFKLTYDEMLKEGKLLQKQSNGGGNKIYRENFTEKRSQGPEDLVDHLMFVSAGIIKISEGLNSLKVLENKFEEISKKLKLYNIIFSYIEEGITFFNSDREFVFSSNRYGLLDGFDLQEKKITMEKIIFEMRKKIINFDEVLDVIELVHTKKNEPQEVDVRLLDNKTYSFKIVPLMQEDVYHGVLIINKLKQNKQ